MKNKNPFRNIYINNIAKWISFSFALSIISLFITLIVFILIYAIKGFNEYGFVNILFQGDFSTTTNQYSFWIPFSITLLTSLLAIVIAVPLSIKSALFIKYRLNKKYKKTIIIIFQVLSGIPSVIFGLFAFESLGKVWLSLFNINPNSIFNGSIMLCFMIIPTIVTMTLDSLNNVDVNLMQQYKGNSENFNSLRLMAESNYTITVTALQEVSYISKGETQIEKFNPVIIEDDFKDVDFTSPIGNITGETGNLGVTYMPTNGGPGKADAENSSSIHININLLLHL